MARPILSYDDITTPSTWTPPIRQSDRDQDHNGRPAKRGKWNDNNAKNNSGFSRSRPHAHWDDPADTSAAVMYDLPSSQASNTNPMITNGSNKLDGRAAFESRKEQTPQSQRPSVGPGHHQKPKNKSRKARGRPKVPQSISLGDSSLWDDRALLNAWDAANEEYKVRMYLLQYTVIPAADTFLS